MSRTILFCSFAALLAACSTQSANQTAMTQERLACAEVGIVGYVAREASVDELVRIVTSLHCGEPACSPRIATMMFRHATAIARERGAAPVSTLTHREHEILALIHRGLTNKEIAAALSIGLTTVKNHVHHVLEKLGVQHRTAAAARFRSEDPVHLI